MRHIGKAKTIRRCVAVAAVLATVSASHADLIYVPWTTVDTNRFTSSTGALWSGNTLTLTYNALERFPNSRAPELVTPLLPNGAIGLFFEVSSTLQNSRAKVEIQTSAGGLDFGFGSTISNEFTAGGLTRWGDLLDWSRVDFQPKVFGELTEVVSGDTAAIEFFFTPEVLASARHDLRFFADGRQQSDEFLDGVTTFSNVSWILGEPVLVPLPPAVWLGSLGILAVIVMRRRIL